jgi:hypothetical protein
MCDAVKGSTHGVPEGAAQPGASRLEGRARSVWVRAALVCSALLLGASALQGCAAVRNELGTAASNCYVDLAVASRAVHHEGKLRGVRLVSVPSLRAHAPLLYRAAVARERRLSQVCLVAFGGRFDATRVERPIGEQTGVLAVVELGYPNRRLLATLLATRPPLPFGHYHL